MSINFENISLLVSGCIDLLATKKCAQVAWTYLDCYFVLRLHRPIKIAILCSGYMDLYDCHLCSGCMDLYDLDYKHFMSINFENISLLVSGCIDLLANKKCVQVAWIYLNCHEYKF